SISKRVACARSQRRFGESRGERADSSGMHGPGSVSWGSSPPGTWSAVMERLSLPDAFARYGARATSQSRALSAIAEDGAVVLNCSLGHFGRPARGVLRYEDRLSREPGDSEGKGLLG